MMVLRTSWETLVWLWKSATMLSDSTPARDIIGQCQSRPPAMKATSAASAVARTTASCRALQVSSRHTSRPAYPVRQIRNRIARPMRNHCSRLMLSIETPSHRVKSGANTT